MPTISNVQCDLIIFFQRKILVYFLQEDVENKSPELLKLGLLLGTMTPERARVKKVPKWLTLPHKIFQDVLAGYFMSKRDQVIVTKQQ